MPGPNLNLTSIYTLSVNLVLLFRRPVGTSHNMELEQWASRATGRRNNGAAPNNERAPSKISEAGVKELAQLSH